MASVTLEKLRKVYPGNIEAVKGADLAIHDEEFLVLVGPSGCGKSTMLRMIAGLEEITEGTIRIGDRIVNDVQPKDRDIAMVFQNYALYPHMTVYKNMAFGLKLRKYPKAEIKKRVSETAELLGIADLLDRKPKALSGGQRQRVAVGRAIVRDPAVFLFDEPLSNLDAKLRVQMRTEISKLHTRLKTTMIYVTHDQVEAMTMGDRIVVMLDGHIQQVATPTELYHEPCNKFVAGFIGSPAMNFLEGRIEAQHGNLHFTPDGTDTPLTLDPAHHTALQSHIGKPITLGIRPEHLSQPTDQSTDQSAATITTTVDVVEPMGHETYLYVHLGDAPLVARIPADTHPTIGETHPLDIAMAKAQYFDNETDLRIS